MNQLNPEIITQIENLASSFLTLLTSHMEQCSSDAEYINLIIGILVFENMTIHNFKNLLKMDNEQDVPEILAKMQDTANIISENILNRLSQNNRVLN